jgi:hypothetical protein
MIFLDVSSTRYAEFAHLARSAAERSKEAIPRPSAGDAAD